MTSIVALAGRPNVGKSTLFNRLTKTRQALVDDLPGVTRDRLYGRVIREEGSFTLVDTGGLDPPADQAFASEVHAQVALAMEEADLIIFLADGRAGLNPSDYEVAAQLRRTAKPVILAVNKVDGYRQEDAAQEFHALGLAPVHFISAAHGYGVGSLLEETWELLPQGEESPLELEDEAGPVRVALLGRPNVGKSSILNSLVGAPRVVVSPVAGTTRDALDTPLNVRGKEYLLIDTAGIRRQGRVERGIEKAGVFRSLRAAERAHVVAVVVDASEGVTDQDLRLAGQAADHQRGLIMVLNKWDLVEKDKRQSGIVRKQALDGLRFAPYAPVLTTSALTGKDLNRLLPTVDQVYADYATRMATGRLNQALEGILERHQPAMVKGKRLKFFYASQVSIRPPTVVVMVNNPGGVHFSYRRYLLNSLREAMGLTKAPLRLIFRERSGRKPKRRGKRGPKRRS